MSKKGHSPHGDHDWFFFVMPHLSWWHGLFFALGLLVASALYWSYPLIQPGGFSSKAGRQPRATADTPPWGNLEYTTLKLERPEETFPEVMPPPNPIHWVFENLSQAQVENLIAEADLSGEQKKLLLNKALWVALPNGWQLSPPVEVVRDMSKAARQKIYAILRQSIQNPFIQKPSRFDAETFDEWLAESGLSGANQQLFRNLAFREGGSIYFYDGQLMDWLCSSAERKNLINAITQTKTLIMKLRVTPQSDLDALIRYWGQGERGEAMRPFLHSLTHVPGGTAVTVSYFFPTFARIRLYTYPDIPKDEMTYRKDCFWTSMNFFSEKPDNHFFSEEELVAKLKSDYLEIPSPSAFGDLIMLLSSQNLMIHMCVYIADDVVFTKNGYTFLAPWVLMKKDEMLKQYPSDPPLRMLTFRKKNLVTQTF